MRPDKNRVTSATTWRPAAVHEDDSGAVPRDDAQHATISGRAADVVDDRGSRRESRGRDGRLGGVDRDRREAADPPDHRQDAAQLLSLADWRGPRPRRFAADVDYIGALGRHRLRVRHGLLDNLEAPAVAEGVRRDVEDPEDRRLLEDG
jgi:hypothetical protein